MHSVGNAAQQAPRPFVALRHLPTLWGVTLGVPPILHKLQMTNCRGAFRAPVVFISIFCGRAELAPTFSILNSQFSTLNFQMCEARKKTAVRQPFIYRYRTRLQNNNDLHWHPLKKPIKVAIEWRLRTLYTQLSLRLAQIPKRHISFCCTVMLAMSFQAMCELL